MAFSKTTVLAVSAALATLAAGQDNANATGTLGIEAIQANFQQAAISGEGNLVPTFDPSALLTVSFPSVGDITPGQSLSIAQTNSTPSLTIQAANSSVQLTDKYTLTMVDAAIVGATPGSNVRHWLVNDVTINGDSVINGTNAVPEQYAGPLPPKGSGSHRYVILLYKQPADFKNPDGFQQGVILDFNLTQYTQETNLGHPIAGSYLQVAGEGPASQSVSQTSSVVTSTLPAAKSTATSPSGSGGSSSASATGSGASSKPTNGATSLAVKSVAALAAGLVAAAALL